MTALIVISTIIVTLSAILDIIDKVRQFIANQRKQ